MNNLFMKVGCSVIVGLDVFPSLIVLVCSYLFGRCIGGWKACSWNIHSIEHGEGGGDFWLHSPSHGLSLFFLFFFFLFLFFPPPLPPWSLWLPGFSREIWPALTRQRRVGCTIPYQITGGQAFTWSYSPIDDREQYQTCRGSIRRPGPLLQFYGSVIASPWR